MTKSQLQATLLLWMIGQMRLTQFFSRKINLSCASTDTLILPIEFMKKENYHRELAPKRKERLLAQKAKYIVTVQTSGIRKPK